MNVTAQEYAPRSTHAAGNRSRINIVLLDRNEQRPASIPFIQSAILFEALPESSATFTFIAVVTTFSSSIVVVPNEFPVHTASAPTITCAITDQRKTSILIDSLGTRQYQLLRPIAAVVESDSDGGYVASFVEANINGSGETEDEAIEMLKDMIASSFALFNRKQTCLGAGPRQQLAVLKKYLED